MPKRAAPSEAAPAVSKKVKPAAAAKAKAAPAKKAATAKAATSKVTRAAKSKLAEVEAEAETAAEAAAETVTEKAQKLGASVKKAASKAKAKVDEVLTNASELLIDDVEPEVTAAASRGQKALAKGKKAAAKVKAKADEVIENAGDLLVDDVADKPASKGKKRKTAEDFIDEEPAPKKAAAKAKAAAAPKAALAKGKGKKAAKEPSPEPEEEEDDEEEGSVLGFETESEDGGADSSDDDSDAEDVAVREAGKKVDVSTLAKPKDDKSVAKRLARAQKQKTAERGTIYLGRIPHGFYEDQMREYFGQFGDVTRLRLARNPKSGASRHYAYIEFSSLPVAEVVAETMNNYLLMGHILKCNVIPQDEIHPELWVGANKKFRKVPRARLEKVRQDKVSARARNIAYVADNSPEQRSSRLRPTRRSLSGKRSAGARSRTPASITSLRVISQWSPARI